MNCESMGFALEMFFSSGFAVGCEARLCLAGGSLTG
jgi:hypothetical protein